MQKDCRNNPCQRYGSALNLNVHLHVLVPDGAYTFEHDKPRFHRAPAPSATELHALLDTLIMMPPPANLFNNIHGCRFSGFTTASNSHIARLH